MRYVHVTVYTALDKLHVVFRQSSRLIGEDILHLRETDTDELLNRRFIRVCEKKEIKPK